MLNGIKERSALWYFYSASANSGAGNNVTALEHAKEAVRLDPENAQYQMLLQRLQNGGSWYQQRQSMYGYPGSFDSSCCVKLCVANLLCNLCCRRRRSVLRRLWRRLRRRLRRRICIVGLRSEMLPGLRCCCVRAAIRSHGFSFVRDKKLRICIYRADFS